jgi:hypothetical protein
VFEFPEIKITDPETEMETPILWPAIEFTVTPPSPQSSELSSARDITAIEVLPPIAAVEKSSWYWWLLVLLLPLAMGVLCVLLLMLRRKLHRTPKERALYEWQRLNALQLPDKGLSERFITLLTLLLRDYLERDCNLPARRQTTPEFLHGLSTASRLTNQDKQFLACFFQRCEAVKFAHVGMTAAECHSLAEQVRHFLLGRPSKKEAV